MDQDELLDDFFGWYIQKYGGAAAGPQLKKIKEVHWALKEDFEEVGTIRKMREKDWVRPGVPIRISKSLVWEAKGFLQSRSSS